MSQELLVVIETDKARDAFLDYAQRHLPAGEAIVKIRDIVGQKRAFRTTLLDKNAQLVGKEPALVLRGGLTALVSYYRVKMDRLEARETHYENGAVTHGYDVILPVARLGQKAAPIVA